jgi:hypothetical protein
LKEILWKYNGNELAISEKNNIYLVHFFKEHDLIKNLSENEYPASINNLKIDILNDIKSFINKLTDVVSLKKFHSIEDKKNNILIILNKYLNKIIEDKIFHLFEENNTEDIFYDIEKKAIKITTEKMKQNEIENKYIIDKKINEQLKKSETIIKDGIKDTIIMDNNQINELKEIHKTHLINFEKKVDNKIKIIFNEIENNIKLSLKDYIEHTIKVENELDNKVEIKMQSYKKMIENKMKDFIDNLFENTDLNNKINNKVNIEINEIYKYVENIFLNLSNNVDNKIVESLNNQIDIKVRLLTNLFNTQFEDVINVISSKVNNNNTDIYSFLQDKVNDIEYNLNQNKYSLLFDKNDNIIRLMNGNEEISNTKINIKGLIGPKGPVGNQGERGESPIIRKIGFTNDKKIKFIIQNSENIYEILSQHGITCNGPTWTPGIQYSTAGELSCFLSHYKVWKQIADANYNDVHIILEDDMNINPEYSLYDFNHAPEYDSIVLYRHPAQKNTPVTYAREGLLHFYWQWGTNAYAITPTFAKELVTSTTHIDEAVDIRLHGRMFPGKRVYVVENEYFIDIGMQSIRT